MPELKVMKEEAQNNMCRGNFKNAVTIYQQALTIVPGDVELIGSLANAQVQSGDLTGAKATLDQVFSSGSPRPDTTCYRLKAAVEDNLGHFRKSISVLRSGIAEYPAAGSLYAEMGRIYAKNRKQSDAVSAWEEGIKSAPVYPGNYALAAEVYLGGSNIMRGLLYGEIFIVLQNDSIGAPGLQRRLYAGYGVLFSVIGNRRKPFPAGASEEVIVKCAGEAMPVLADGITTENLVMFRTKIAMKWQEEFAAGYPFPLFEYWDELLKSGKFEVYNEWLFGKAESEAQFTVWNTFHDGDIYRFLEWQNRQKTLAGKLSVTGMCW